MSAYEKEIHENNFISNYNGKSENKFKFKY